MGIVSGKKGSALIMALVTITVLLVLGLAVTTMSMGTLKSNVADATTNDAYYAAEAGVNSAIEHIKHEVSNYYAAMADAYGTGYNTLYENFFANITSNASLSFSEPRINAAVTETSFSVGSYDSATQAGELLISTTSTTADRTQYMVNGSVIVKRLDLKSDSWFVPNTVLYVGGAIDLDTQYKMNAAGNVIAGELRELNANPNNSRFRHTDGTLVIDPHAGDSLSDVALYTSYSDPVLPRIDVYITENGFNYTAGSAGDIYITTAPGINFSMSGSGIAGGIIHGKGNISISSIGNVYADIYADGDLYISNGAFYGDIYCRGNLTINGGSYHGDITCDGNISVSNLNNNGLIKSNGDVTVTDATNTGSVYAAGTITLIRANLAGVIYSSSDINIGSGKIRGIIYSVNHVKITSGCSVEGSLFAKGNVYYGPPAGEDDTMNITYSQSVINDALQDSKNEFLFSGSGDGGNTVLDDSVFVSQSVTAIGRQ